ncbi:MAG: hypothetical protein ACLFSM_08490 [Thermoplasmata archaeon]
MFGVEVLLQIIPIILQTIPTFGSPFCIGLIVLAVIIFLFAYFLSLLIEFLPATLLAILVYLFTGNLIWSIVAFVVIALLMMLGRGRKRIRR